MRFFKNFLGLIALAAMLFSCQKEMSVEDAKIPGVIDAKWEFKESDVLYNGDLDTASLETSEGLHTLLLRGNKAGDENSEILLQITTSNLVPGVYTSPQIFFQYSENGAVRYQNIPNQADGLIIEITSIDSVSISGTFSGLVQDSEGNLRNIVEGKFIAVLIGAPTDEEPLLDDYLPRIPLDLPGIITMTSDLSNLNRITVSCCRC